MLLKRTNEEHRTSRVLAALPCAKAGTQTNHNLLLIRKIHIRTDYQPLTCKPDGLWSSFDGMKSSPMAATSLDATSLEAILERDAMRNGKDRRA